MASPGLIYRQLPRSRNAAVFSHIAPLSGSYTITRRTFLSNIFNPEASSSASSPEVISANRTLPYSASDLYGIISDIDSYHEFIPYCTRSQVLARTQTPSSTSSSTSPSKPSPAIDTPTEASLVISWNQLEESFTSRLRCQPDKAIEACSGTAQFTLPAHPSSSSSSATNPHSSPSENDTSVFSHLLTRWTLRGYPYKPPSPQISHSVSSTGPPKSSSGSPSRPTDSGPSSQSAPTVGTQPDAESGRDPGKNDADGEGTVTKSASEVAHRTDVGLYVEYVFRNPIYGAMSKVAAPKVAGRIVEAFEERARVLAERKGGS